MSDYDDVIVPAGMTPLDPESGEPKETPGTEEPNEAPTNENTEETTATAENTETVTGETTETPEQPVATEDNTPTEETPQEESSLHDETDYYTFQNLVDEYNEQLGEDQAPLHELMEFKYRDLENMDPRDLIEDGMIFETPDITDNELDVLLDKFEPLFLTEQEQDDMIEDGDLSRNQLNALQAEFDRTARKYRRILEDHQDSIDFNEIIINQQQAVQEQQASTGLTEEKIAEYKDTLTDLLNDYDGETLKVVSEEGESLLEFKFGVGADAKADAINTAANPQNVYNRWMNEDGTIDHQKYISDQIKLDNFEKILKSVYDQAIAKGTDDNIKNMNNITDAKTQRSSTGAKTPTAHDHLLGTME